MNFAIVCIIALVGLGLLAAIVSHFQGGDDEIVTGHDCTTCTAKEEGSCQIACLMERQRTDASAGTEKKKPEDNKTGEE